MQSSRLGGRNRECEKVWVRVVRGKSLGSGQGDVGVVVKKRVVGKGENKMAQASPKSQRQRRTFD